LNFHNTYKNLPPEFYSNVAPTPVKSPEVILFNKQLANDLSIDLGMLTIEKLAQIFSGNVLPDGAEPIAQAYAGHQFGHFTLLGDGRAVLLGEQLTKDGKRFDIQLKGSGPTPYSRIGDGRATLKSMLREYLISEAMYFLGIPSSRSLAVVSTGEEVYRETSHRGAVLTRVMDSHIRVGTFEFARHFLTIDDLRKLMDYSISRHFPEIEKSENPALELLKATMYRQIDLVINWLRIGFVHGVMNTDNTSVTGECFDYGPCAFMNTYNPKTVFSSIDHQGRYAFGNQVPIAQWNMAVFGGTLLPLIDEDADKALELAQAVINEFPILFQQKWLQMMCAKLGILDAEKKDAHLINSLLDWMYHNKIDYTNCFTKIRLPHLDLGEKFESAEFNQWQQKWEMRVEINPGGKLVALEIMAKHNPVFIPRNHLVENALDNVDKEGDFQLFHQFLKLMENAYNYDDRYKQFLQIPEDSDQTYQTFCGT
jgi:serine/tyrosine/threonine adenylyltransferase